MNLSDLKPKVSKSCQPEKAEEKAPEMENSRQRA